MKPKKAAFTLLELIVALAIASVFLTVAFRTVGQSYTAQKRILVQQNFHTETRFLMDRIVQTVRNNTIDYDRAFLEVGPDTTACTHFVAEQTQSGIGNLSNNNADAATNRGHRKSLGYSEIFYWIFSGGAADITRNMGGLKADGSTPDPCSIAFHGTLDTLYLINGDRNARSKITLDSESITLQQQLGADANNNDTLEESEWSHDTDWTQGACKIGSYFVQGDPDENICESVHDDQAISPPRLKITNLTFEPAPTRDPFLAFGIEDAQVHPHVFISLTAELRDHADFSFSVPPTITLQTTASSRVFGNTRQ